MPTVPKRMVLPRTVPLRGTLTPRFDESLIVPFNFDPNCVH